MSVVLHTSATSRHGVIDIDVCLDAENRLSGRRAVTFFAVPRAGKLEAGSYELTLVEIDAVANVWQVNMIIANRKDLQKRGVGPALLKLAKRHLGGTIRSSSRKPEHQVADAEKREAPATNMWERIVEAGDAVYDVTTDRYTLL